MKKLILSITIMFCLYSFGQTGPAGIKSNTEVKVWLDANQITSATPGGTLGLWDDISGNSNNLIQISSLLRPTFQNGGANNKSYVEFSGDYMTSGSISSFDTDQLTWLYVGSFNNASPQAYEIVLNQSYTSHDYQYLTYYNNVVGGIRNIAYAPTYKSAASNTFSTNTTFNMTIRDVNKLTSYTNGTFMQAVNTLSGSPSGHNSTRIGALAGSSPTYYFNGKLYEVIAINGALNDAEINILSNYISSKYANPVAIDLYTYDSNHGENVIGIGTETNGSNLIARGQGVVSLSNAEDMTNGKYFLIGDDAISLANTNPDVPSGEPAGTNRFERIWRVGENQGDVGNMTITLHIDTYRPGTSPSTIKLYIDTDDGVFTNATPISGTYDAGAETVTFVNINMADGNYFSFGGSESDIESTGITSDWDLTTTWNCGCIPSLSDSVTILSGHTVNVVNSGANARTIVIQSSGFLDFTGGELNLDEHIVSSGSFNITNGKLILDGSIGVQTISFTGSSNIDNLTVLTSSGAIFIGGTMFINGTFLMNGNIDNSGLSDFVINSSASGDGRIGLVPGTIAFSNPITVRRNIPSGNADYRNLSPVTFPFTLAQWDDELVISGDGYPDGCALQAGSCFYSTKKWDGSAFFDVAAINSTHTVGTGFHMYLGDDLSTFSGATLESNGVILSGSFSQVGYTNWNYLGNPYPSAIDFTSLQPLSFRMDNYFYVYDPSTAAYEWWEPGLSGTLDEYISMGQAFWVAPPTGATQPLQANYNELMKTDQTPTWKALNQSPALSLTIKSAHNNYKHRIAFNTVDSASVNHDGRDIPFLVSPNENAPHIAVINEYNDKINVTYFNENEVTASFSMIANTPRSDYYTIKAENIVNFNQYSCIYLLDLKTNESINLRDENEYTFFVDQTKSDDVRFMIVFSNDPDCISNDVNVLGTNDALSNDENVTIQQLNNIFNVNFNFNSGEQSNITVINTLGQTVYETGNFNISKGTKSLNLSSNVSGVHFIKVQHGNEVTTKKVYIQN